MLQEGLQWSGSKCDRKTRAGQRSVESSRVSTEIQTRTQLASRLRAQALLYSVPLCFRSTNYINQLRAPAVPTIQTTGRAHIFIASRTSDCYHAKELRRAPFPR